MGGFRSGPIPGPPGPASELVALETTTDLRNDVPGVADAVRVLNDGARAGLFYFDTTPAVDNNGTRFNLGGIGSNQPGWVRIYDGPIDVRWFDAKGDGVTDDVVALQRALNAAALETHAVNLQGLTYIIGATLNLVSNVEILGSGGTIKAKDNTTFNAVLTGAGISNIVVRDLTLDANGPNRTDPTNTKDGARRVGETDSLWDNVTVINTRGTPGSAVAFALTTGLRVRYVNCSGKSLGVAGHISDCFYSNGSYIYIENFYAEPTDTGCVFENCSNAGAMNGRIFGNGAGAGIGASVAGNTDVENLFFQGIIINNVIAPIEFGLFGARTNTGKIKNTRFADILVDSATSTFPVIFFYPNPQVNPTNLEYSGRIEDVTIDGIKVINNGGSQGVYATTTDGLYVRGCDMVNMVAACVQVGGAGVANSDACTRVVIEDNVFQLGALTTFGIQLQDGDDYLIQDNRIKGGPDTAWGVYYFGTCTNCRTPRNIITGGALGDESGVGADNTTQARSAADGPFYGTTTPQPGTGIWPLGATILNTAIVNTNPFLETAAKPWGWQCTTAGVPGVGAVFTPFYREGRSIGDAGILNTANALDYVRAPSGSGNQVAYNARGDSSDASKFIGFAFSNASNAAGNLGYFASDGNGNCRLSVLAGLTIGTQTNANFPATFTGIIDLDAKGWRALAAQGGYYLGSSGQYGGVQHGTDVANGVAKFGASVRGELGISAGNAPWSSWTPGLYWRAITGATAIGINRDPSDRAALMSIAAGSSSYDQVCFIVSSSLPSTLVDGMMSYSSSRLTFTMGTTVRYNIALKVVDKAYNFTTTINAGVQTDLTISGVTGAAVGDKVIIDFTSGGLDAGLIFGGAWVSAADTVKVRIYNPTGSNITPASVNWNVSVIHT